LPPDLSPSLDIPATSPLPPVGISTIQKRSKNRTERRSVPEATITWPSNILSGENNNNNNNDDDDDDDNNSNY
jgi:hypothetical protein